MIAATVACGAPAVNGSSSSVQTGIDGNCPPAASADISLDTGTGTLSGTLEQPGRCGSVPLVLFHSGSGPTDRDGNQLAGGIDPGTIKLLAQALAANGIASVRYDKRGVGASAAAAPPETELRLQTYVADAVAWVKMLKIDARFSRVVFAGHSEGSLIGILASQQSPVSAFVSLEGPGRPLSVVLKQQLSAQLSGSLLEQADEIIDELVAGETVANPPQSLDSLFDPSVQPYLISELAVNPAQQIANLTVPILVVQGTTDTQVTVQDAMLLAGANARSTLLIVDGMSHELKAATLAAASQQMTNTNPLLPVEPSVVAGITRLVQGLTF